MPALSALDFFDFLAGFVSVALVLAAVVDAASSVAFDFFDFFVDFDSVALASALASDCESSALAFLDFLDFVLLLSSAVVLLAALVVVVAEVSAFFFLAAAANAGVNARPATNIRIAVIDAGPFARNVIGFSCYETSGEITLPVQLPDTLSTRSAKQRPSESIPTTVCMFVFPD